MRIIKPWVNALHISETDFFAWQKEAPSSEDFTFWCLQKNKISAQEYFEWAQNNYGVAFLQSAFFDEPNYAFWRQVSSITNWSPALMPVAEWDGVLFIACVDPDQDIKWSFPVQYVLASTQDLQRYWKTLIQAQLETTPAPMQTNVDNAVPSETTSHHITDSLPPIPFEEAPAGFSISASNQPTTNLSPDFMDQLAKKVGTTNSDEDLNAPENLNWKPKKNLTEKDMAPVGMLSSESTNSQSLNTDNFTNTFIPQDRSQIVFSQESTVQTPVSQVVNTQVAQDPSIIISPSATPSPEITYHTASRKSTMPPVPPDSAVQMQNVPRSLHDFTTLAQSEFRGGMLIEIQNEQFTPLIWDQNFKPASPNSLGRKSLNQPSAFRVAYRSKMPYLGRIVDTPINKDFFMSWGFQNLPENILIHPVVIDKNVKYLIVALSDAEKKNNVILASGEKLSNEIKKRLAAAQAA